MDKQSSSQSIDGSQGDTPPLQKAVTEMPMKKRRGRPRKHPEDEFLLSAVSPQSISSSISKAVRLEILEKSDTVVLSLNQDKNLIPKDQTQHSQEQENRVSGAANCTYHTLTIIPGEDIVMKVMSFCQQRPAEAVCILSANGVISKATIVFPHSPETPMIYEGKYEILSLSGSLVPRENKWNDGIMSVSLVGLEGHVVGGRVAGPLVAASHACVTVGHFLASDKHEQRQKTQKNEVTSTAMPTAAASTSTAVPIPDIPSSTVTPTKSAQMYTFVQMSDLPSSTVTPTKAAPTSTFVEIFDLSSSTVTLMEVSPMSTYVPTPDLPSSSSLHGDD